jgi:hypothetical protein
MNIFDDISLFGSVSATAHPLFRADNRLVRRDLLVYRTLQFDEQTTTYEFFTQHPPPATANVPFNLVPLRYSLPNCRPPCWSTSRQLSPCADVSASHDLR